MEQYYILGIMIVGYLCGRCLEFAIKHIWIKDA